jgi:head-tail adaptor
MRNGACNKWVTLSRSAETTSEDPHGNELTPSGVWAAIEPLAPGGSDNRTLTHVVRMRFHPEVTVDTRIDYADARLGRTRLLFVRGLQVVDEAGDEMRLLAEEVMP